MNSSEDSTKNLLEDERGFKPAIGILTMSLSGYTLFLFTYF